jgi:hypothetical protein
MNNIPTKFISKSFLKKMMLCVLLLNTISDAAKAQVYCSPTFASTACSFVPYIDFSLSSASFSGTTFCTGVPCPTNYGDYFSTYTANLTEGNSYALTINYNASSSLVDFSIYCGAWIDWNNDGTFDDATERIMTTNVGPAGAITQTGANFTPVAVGTFRMRLILQTGSNPTNPCTTGGVDNGEAKDFKVVVAPVSVGNIAFDKQSNFKVYPNPSELNGIFIEGLNNLNSVIQVKLIDVLGKTVVQKLITANTNGAQFIELLNTPKGIYNLEVTDGKSIHNFKIVLSN